MKFIVTILLIFLLNTIGNTQHPSSEIAKNRAVEFLSSYSQSTQNVEAASQSLQLQHSWNSDGLYCFEFENSKGFIIVKVIQEEYMILAFSTNSSLNLENGPPALSLLLSEYRHFSSITEDSTDPYVNNEITPANVQFVTPLLTTTWDQRCNFNDSCPADTLAPAYFCGRAPAGCVASAMGQIMRYFEWPLQGVGSNSYYDSNYGTLSANFANTSYNWQSMPLALYSGHPGVAQMMFHIGIATDMDYGPYGSGTGALDARNALVNHFNYKSSAQHIVKLSYTSSAWKALLQNELDQARPVFYGGVDATNGGGHAFVCDGYYGNDYYHINWGWSGVGDGYFMLSNLNPLGNANYINLQEAIIGIEPTISILNAEFTANSESVDMGNNITFTDLSFGSPTTFNWIFEGGLPATSLLQVPGPVTYNEPGVYDVILIVGDGSSLDTLIKENYIAVKPYADFQASSYETQVGKGVNFYENCLVSSPVSQFNWTFFGASQPTSNTANPQNIIWNNPGQYPVMLEINSGGGTHKNLKTKFITVHNQCDTMFDYAFPGYWIQPSNQGNFTVNFEDLDGFVPYHTPYISSGWDVFDEIPTPGDTNWFISATSLFQSAGIADNWLTFGPVTIPASGAVLQWRQKYPDHTKRDGFEILINENGITHQYFTGAPLLAIADNDPATVGDTVWTLHSVDLDSAGYGNKQLYIAFHHNADNMFYIAFDDIAIKSCNGYPLYADFLAWDSNVVTGENVTFYDISSGYPIAWNWQFIGAQTTISTDKNPVATWLNPGVYDVSLTVTYDGAIQKTITKNAFIKVMVGINENQYNNDIQIIPNPATSKIVVISNSFDIERYKIVDVTGKIVYEGTIASGGSIFLGSLKSGIYFLQLLIDNQTVCSRKFIKQ